MIFSNPVCQPPLIVVHYYKWSRLS